MKHYQSLTLLRTFWEQIEKVFLCHERRNFYSGFKQVLDTLSQAWALRFPVFSSSSQQSHSIWRCNLVRRDGLFEIPAYLKNRLTFSMCSLLGKLIINSGWRNALGPQRGTVKYASVPSLVNSPSPLGYCRSTNLSDTEEWVAENVIFWVIKRVRGLGTGVSKTWASFITSCFPSEGAVCPHGSSLYHQGSHLL